MAGGPCPASVMQGLIEQMHMRDITIMYGQTETSPVNHMTGLDAPLDKRCETVALGEKGELCCKGYPVMKSYWDEPQQTSETIDSDGWLHSGDLAVMDDEGYVQIVERIKDMIIRGGENIYPREVEEFLYSHPTIQEVQVFGIPDDKVGEVVCA
jgi:fatty-acyl-CoA synthase